MSRHSSEIGYGDKVPEDYGTFARETDDVRREVGMNAKSAREMGVVLQYVNRLDNELDALDHAISELITLISPVLNPNASGEGGDPSTEKSQSNLANILESKCARVLSLTKVVQDVIRRVEL